MPDEVPAADPGAAAVPAVVAEATRRSGVVWLAAGDGRPSPVWHLWHEGAAYVVCGGAEQPLPFPADTARAVVMVRSKATRNDRPVAWVAAVEPVRPGKPLWDEVVPLLHARRLNAPDGEHQPARWARESVVLRLTPTGQVLPPTTDPELRGPSGVLAPPRR